MNDLIYNQMSRTANSIFDAGRVFRFEVIAKSMLMTAHLQSRFWQFKPAEIFFIYD